jgi:ATP-dependent DNA helicase RecG
MRGPGEFFGTRQSGELKFSAADLSKDKQIVEKTRDSAFKLAEEDPQLRTPENIIIRNHFLVHYKDSLNLINVG